MLKQIPALVAHETDYLFPTDISADRARCEAAIAEILEANEGGMVQAQILGALEHCLLLFGGCELKRRQKAILAPIP
jgi:hypothetical protein